MEEKVYLDHDANRLFCLGAHPRSCPFFIANRPNSFGDGYEASAYRLHKLHGRLKLKTLDLTPGAPALLG